MPRRKTTAMIVSRLDLQQEGIQPRIVLVRGHRVLLDRDLAVLYEVKAIALRQQVRRNPKRFPKDFVFELKQAEVDILVTQKCDTLTPGAGRFHAACFHRTWDRHVVFGSQ